MDAAIRPNLAAIMASTDPGWAADDYVLSDVHVETCPPLHVGSRWTTCFSLRAEPAEQPTQSLDFQLDEDGDLDPPRQSQGTISTQHNDGKTSCSA